MNPWSGVVIVIGILGVLGFMTIESNAHTQVRFLLPVYLHLTHSRFVVLDVGTPSQKITFLLQYDGDFVYIQKSLETSSTTWTDLDVASGVNTWSHDVVDDANERLWLDQGKDSNTADAFASLLSVKKPTTESIPFHEDVFVFGTHTIRLPVRTGFPDLTSMGISMEGLQIEIGGVLGLGRSSPLWTFWDRFTKQRDSLLLGAFDDVTLQLSPDRTLGMPIQMMPLWEAIATDSPDSGYQIAFNARTTAKTSGALLESCVDSTERTNAYLVDFDEQGDIRMKRKTALQIREECRANLPDSYEVLVVPQSAQTLVPDVFHSVLEAGDVPMFDIYLSSPTYGVRSGTFVTSKTETASRSAADRFILPVWVGGIEHMFSKTVDQYGRAASLFALGVGSDQVSGASVLSPSALFYTTDDRSSSPSSSTRRTKSILSDLGTSPVDPNPKFPSMRWCSPNHHALDKDLRERTSFCGMVSEWRNQELFSFSSDDVHDGFVLRTVGIPLTGETHTTSFLSSASTSVSSSSSSSLFSQKTKFHAARSARSPDDPSEERHTILLGFDAINDRFMMYHEPYSGLFVFSPVFHAPEVRTCVAHVVVCIIFSTLWCIFATQFYPQQTEGCTEMATDDRYNGYYEFGNRWEDPARPFWGVWIYDLWMNGGLGLNYRQRIGSNDMSAYPATVTDRAPNTTPPTPPEFGSTPPKVTRQGELGRIYELVCTMVFSGPSWNYETNAVYVSIIINTFVVFLYLFSLIVHHNLREVLVEFTGNRAFAYAVLYTVAAFTIAGPLYIGLVGPMQHPITASAIMQTTTLVAFWMGIVGVFNNTVSGIILMLLSHIAATIATTALIVSIYDFLVMFPARADFAAIWSGVTDARPSPSPTDIVQYIHSKRGRYWRTMVTDALTKITSTLDASLVGSVRSSSSSLLSNKQRYRWDIFLGRLFPAAVWTIYTWLFIVTVNYPYLFQQHFSEHHASPLLALCLSSLFVIPLALYLTSKELMIVMNTCAVVIRKLYPPQEDSSLSGASHTRVDYENIVGFER